MKKSSSSSRKKQNPEKIEVIKTGNLFYMCNLGLMENIEK
jgi:hypothetical protein